MKGFTKAWFLGHILICIISFFLTPFFLSILSFINYLFLNFQVPLISSFTLIKDVITAQNEALMKALFALLTSTDFFTCWPLL